MNLTHVFTLPSGVECEVKEFQGKHQKLLTKQEGSVTDSMNVILADIIVRVGSVKAIDQDFVEGMLTADRNWAMFQARQFSLEFPEVFKVPVKYKQDGRTIEDDVVIQMSEVSFKPYGFQVVEYDQIQRKHEVTIKRYEGKVSFSLLDGRSEKMLALTKKKDVSSHLDLIGRNPTYLTKNTPIKLNLDDLGLMSIEDLRRQIYEIEGKVKADFQVEHPNADSLFGDEKMIRVNLLADPNFFFPSGVYS